EQLDRNGVVKTLTSNRRTSYQWVVQHVAALAVHEDARACSEALDQSEHHRVAAQQVAETPLALVVDEHVHALRLRGRSVPRVALLRRAVASHPRPVRCATAAAPAHTAGWSAWRV